MEDVRELEFPSLPTGIKEESEAGSSSTKNDLSSEQLEAVDELITAMDMSNAEYVFKIL